MMNVLSLCDGISCGAIAMKQAGFDITNYYAAEIDKFAQGVSEYHWPELKRVGDVYKLTYKNRELHYFPHVVQRNGAGRPIKQTLLREMQVDKINFDLLLCGSSCQDLSTASSNKHLGLNGPMSSVFWRCLTLLKEVRPNYFLFENVASMAPNIRNDISSALGCRPVEINSAIFGAQSRKRLYWTNIDFKLPKNQSPLCVKDILDSNRSSLYAIPSITIPGYVSKIGSSTNKNRPRRVGHINNDKQGQRIYDINYKSVCLLANGGGSYKQGLYQDGHMLYKPTVTECERLQNLPDGYTQVPGNSASQSYKQIGNGWDVAVISHILGHMK